MNGESLDLVRLGRAIVRWREKRGWTTYRLAQKTGVGDPYLRRLEQGQGARVGLDVLVRLAGALGTTADTLLAEAGVPTAQGHRHEVESIYRSLDAITRPAWLRMGRTLQEIQDEYSALQRGEADELPGAAFPLAEAAEAKEDVEMFGEERVREEGEDR